MTIHYSWCCLTNELCDWQWKGKDVLPLLQLVTASAGSHCAWLGWSVVTGLEVIQEK